MFVFRSTPNHVPLTYRCLVKMRYRIIHIHLMNVEVVVVVVNHNYGFFSFTLVLCEPSLSWLMGGRPSKWHFIISTGLGLKKKLTYLLFLLVFDCNVQLVVSLSFLPNFWPRRLQWCRISMNNHPEGGKPCGVVGLTRHMVVVISLNVCYFLLME